MNTGYGVVVTNFLLNLIKQGVDVTAWPVHNNAEGLPEHYGVIQNSIKRQDAFDCNAPCLRIFHQFSMAESIGRGKRIGMPIFELDTFTSREKAHLSSLDHILVNSSWAKRVVEENGITVPTDIVPLGYDPTIFYPTTPPKRSSVVFLNVGKWSLNKGHDVLKTIFERAFSPADNVELWMCCHNRFLFHEERREWERYYCSGPLASKIRIIPWQDTQYQLADLMNQADVGVFPARGEGWNLEALEMMACGKTVLGTYYSGQADFITCGIPIRDKKESAYDGKWFFGNGNWALLDNTFQNMFAIQMKKMYRDLLDNKKCDESSIKIAKEYTWEKSTSKLMSVIFN